MIETNVELIPETITDIKTLFPKFKAELRSCGFPTDMGIRNNKCAILLCIQNLISKAVPDQYIESRFKISPSTSSQDLDDKLRYGISIYKTCQPLIRQYIIYS